MTRLLCARLSPLLVVVLVVVAIIVCWQWLQPSWFSPARVVVAWNQQESFLHQEKEHQKYHHHLHHLPDNPSIEREHVVFLASRRRLEEAVRPSQQRPSHHHRHHYHLHLNDSTAPSPPLSLPPLSWVVNKEEEVDGLKNDDVVVFISSTTLGNDHYLWDRIIPSARTWMPFFHHVFVIVEDNFLIRYALRLCHWTNYPSYTVFSCPNEPNYLLTRKCTNDYYGGHGLCCKIDAALDFLINEEHDLYQHVRYLLEGDDDTYFRGDQVLRWLAAVERSGLSDLYPLIANADRSSRPDNGGVWHIEGCQEIHTNGWYQPFMMNKLALDRLQIPSRAYGLRDTCLAFEVSQDVGIGPYAWMMEFVHILFPGVEINPRHLGSAIFRSDLMVLHCVRHDLIDHCDRPESWPLSLRYRQDVVVGCGNMEVANPRHNATSHSADMYDAHRYFSQHGQPLVFTQHGVNEFMMMSVVLLDGEGEEDEEDPASQQQQQQQQQQQHPHQHHQHRSGRRKIKAILSTQAAGNSSGEGDHHHHPVHYRLIPSFNPLKGFRQTSFARIYNVTKDWHVFRPENCEPPGQIERHH